MANDDFISVNLLNERKLLRDIEAIPDDIRAILREKIKSWTYQLRDLVESNIVERLRRVTGKLEDSVDVEFTEDGLRIEGHVFIHGVPYARAQEDGAEIPPHMIFPKNGKVLAFMAASGDKVFATHVFHPGGLVPPKHFMKDAYREMSPKITRGLYYQVIEKARNRLRRAGRG